MPAGFKALPKSLYSLADGAPPSAGVLLVGRSFSWKVKKRRPSFRQNFPFRRCGQGANPTCSDINTEDYGRA